MRQAARVLGVLLMFAVLSVAGGFLNHFFANQAMLPEALARPFIEDVRDTMERWAYETNRDLDQRNRAMRESNEALRPGANETGFAPVLAGAAFDRRTDTYTKRFFVPGLSRAELQDLYQEVLVPNMKYALSREACAPMKQAFDEGIRMVFVYQGRDGAELFRVTLDKTTCAKNPPISRTELQDSLERSARYINANTGRINAVNRRKFASDMDIELVGAIFRDTVFAYAYRFYDLENVPVFSNEELAAIQNEMAAVSCTAWPAYLDAGYAIAEIYLDSNNEDLGAVFINEEICRPYRAAAAELGNEFRSRYLNAR